MKRMLLVPAAFAALTVVIVVACAIEEEPSFIAGGWCDTPGVTACDDTFMTILYCNDEYLWEPLKDCPEGCTEESGLATCIGGGSPDNAVPDTSDTQTPDLSEIEGPDTNDEATGDDATVIDETNNDDTTDMDPVDTATDEDAVTDDDQTDQTDQPVDDVDDAVVTDDAVEVEDDVVTDDATASDDDAPADCSGDWTLNDTTGTCYRYFADAKSFEAAENACVAETGHLVSLASLEENDWVRDSLGIPADTAYWIGYTAKDAVGPGTGSANGQSCGSSSFATNSGGGSYTFSTSGASTFSTGCLCTGSTVSGKFVVFKFVPSVAGRWELAMNSTNDGHMSLYTSCSCSAKLACANNTTSGWEIINTYNFTAGTTYYIMISGPTNLTGTFYIRPPITTSNFADHYVWTDGSSDLYDNFATGQPDYGSGNERCAHVRVDAPWGEWNDNQCSTLLPYVCEK